MPSNRWPSSKNESWTAWKTPKPLVGNADRNRSDVLELASAAAVICACTAVLGIGIRRIFAKSRNLLLVTVGGDAKGSRTN